ncbi:hypothetical protein AMATHDRAFT_2959 [Amanita thiersii Skay4041]|uniref:Ribonuclease H1 N-terminal domain-containing protein n=1 Tax=Amanita thiersii Skay4041 TaxID=703135 RepID=A0A2A9NV18_9AGAR|nr:hypothetical protein AMATHDRAFT_2959 [Amanita thiersii Skay4041]
MARKKWYVVTVGAAVGVYTSWLQVAPLVIGISGASHQSFPTEAEAVQAFATANARGEVKAVAPTGNAVAPSISISSSQGYSGPSTPRWSHSHGSPSPMHSHTSAVNNTNTLKRAYSEGSYAGRQDDGAGQQYQGKVVGSPAYCAPSTSKFNAASVQSPSELGYYQSEHNSRTTVSSNEDDDDGLLTPLRSPALHFGKERGGTDLKKRMPTRHSQTEGKGKVPSSGSKLSSSKFTSKDSQPEHLPNISVLHVHCQTCQCHKFVKMKCLCRPGSAGHDGISSRIFQPMHVLHTVYSEQLDPRSPMAKRSLLPKTTK